MTSQTAIVTGAGSGVGRAVALRLAAEGWSVALVGRRAEPLQETRAIAGTCLDCLHVLTCDVADPSAVETMARSAVEKLGSIQVLVNAAGTNTPRRSFEELSIKDFQELIHINLNGTFYCIHAVLPVMRRQGGGTIVNIGSDAGLIANAKAGPAYSASKFGVTGLTQSLNAEERHNGIRACGIFPGDIDTPILDKRPAPPSREARAQMLQSEDVADCIMLAIHLPAHAVMEQLVIRPR